MDTEAGSLIIITAEYPFGNKSESFLDAELSVLSKIFEKIILLPMHRPVEHMRRLPGNVEVSTVITDVHQTYPLRSSSQITSFLKDFLYEFSCSENRMRLVLHLRNLFSIYRKALYRAEILNTFLGSKPGKRLIYSYWFNEGALLLTCLKKQGRINHFFSRAHRFDLYDEWAENRFIPFRYYIMREISAVFCVSASGTEYLQKKTSYPEKVKLSFLGTTDHGIQLFDPASRFTLVTCSGMSPVKRVPMVPLILKHISFPVKWVHIGDGPERPETEKNMHSLPANVHVELKGQLSNQEVLGFYANNQVNLFLNISESEGLPVSLMEALSFGIPLMATDAGGSSEIACDETGFLIPVNFEPEAIAELIDSFRNSDKNNTSFRKSVREFWLKKFNAESNYRKFAEQLMTIADRTVIR